MSWCGKKQPDWTGSFYWKSKKKKRAYGLWKKWQATQEVHKDVIRSWREKITKAKAQLELDMATAVKDNKNWFYKYINNIKRAKKNIHLLLVVEGNIVTKDEEKAVVLDAFLASVFNRKTSDPKGNQPPELVVRDREQGRPPALQEEVVGGLLSHLDPHKCVGSDGIHLRIVRELSPSPSFIMSPG